MKLLRPSFLFFTALACLNIGCSLSLNCEKPVGDAIEKEIALEAFHTLHLKNSVTVYIEQGEEQKITAKGAANLINLLNTTINDNTWEVKFDKCIQQFKTFEIHVVMPDINEIGIYGSGDIIANSTTIKTKNLKLHIHGSGDIKLDGDVKTLEAAIYGSGDIQLSGKADEQNIAVSGSGDVSAYALKSDDCKVDIRGSGDVKVTAKKSLSVTISGSGDVRYKGKPSEVVTNVKGSGEVQSE
jgi:hypothetical protein